jgi:hypothetical protein
VRNGSVTPRKEGFAKKNAGFAPREVVCCWRDGRGVPSIDKIGVVTQALLVEKAPQIYIRISYLASLTNVHF